MEWNTNISNMPKRKQTHCFPYPDKCKSENDSKYRPRNQYYKFFILFYLNGASGTNSDSNSLVKHSAEKGLLFEQNCYVFCQTCCPALRLCCKRISSKDGLVMSLRPFGIFNS